MLCISVMFNKWFCYDKGLVAQAPNYVLPHSQGINESGDKYTHDCILGKWCLLVYMKSQLFITLNTKKCVIPSLHNSSDDTCNRFCFYTYFVVFLYIYSDIKWKRYKSICIRFHIQKLFIVPVNKWSITITQIIIICFITLHSCIS